MQLWCGGMCHIVVAVVDIAGMPWVVSRSSGGQSTRVTEVTVGGFVGTGLDVFSFDAPVASDVLRNAPLTGDGSVTVTGLGFGLFEYTATAALGSAACSTTSWSSASSVVCQASELLWIRGVCGGDCGCDERHRGGGAHIRPWAGGGVLVRCACGVWGDAECAAQRRRVCDCEWAELRAAALHSDSGARIGTMQHIVLEHRGHRWLCQMRSADVEAQTAELTVGGVVGTGYGVFTFDAPVASFVELNMAHSFGGSVTVTGLNFRYVEYTATGAAAVWGVLDDIVELFDECSSALRVRCGMLRGVCTM